MIYLIEDFKEFERYVPEISFLIFFESGASPNPLYEIFVFLLQIIKLYSSFEKIKSKIAKNKFSIDTNVSHIRSKYDFGEYDSTNLWAHKSKAISPKKLILNISSTDRQAPKLISDLVKLSKLYTYLNILFKFADTHS